MSQTTVLITNIITPYRASFYEQLYKEHKIRGDRFFVVCMAETEPDRKWNFHEYKKDYCILLHSRTLKISGAYIHLTYDLEKVVRKLQPTHVVCAGSYLQPALYKILCLEKKLGYKVWFWSESHLEQVSYRKGIELTVREFLRKFVYGHISNYWYAGHKSLEFIKTYSKNIKGLIYVPNLINEKKYDSVNGWSDDEKAKIRDKYGIPENRIVLFSASRLSEIKGIYKFVDEIFSNTIQNNVTYIIAGDGDERKKLEQIINERKLSVKLLGELDEEKVIECLSIADVYVLPSRNDANPLSCIEACWCGLPLFLSNGVGNHPELVKSGENGYVYDYYDLNDGIDKLNNIIKKDEKWKKSAREISYKIAQSNYRSSTNICRIVDELLKE